MYMQELDVLKLLVCKVHTQKNISTLEIMWVHSMLEKNVILQFSKSTGTYCIGATMEVQTAKNWPS